MIYTLLPGLFTLCAMFGIGHAQCAADFPKRGIWSVQNAARRETDPAKWYTIEASNPDKYGKPTNCVGPIAVAHYRIFDGSRGTVWACRFPPEDDHITERELETIRASAMRLNSISPKTYQDHQEAMYLKSIAKMVDP